MSNPKEPKPPANPGTRATLYGMGALYLAYLYYQIARPYLTGDPYSPTLGQFVLGTVILGGGAVALGVLAWRMYKAPQPEEPEDPALPEESEEDQEEE